MDKEKLNKELDAVTDFFYDDINGEFAGEIVENITELIKPKLESLIYLLVRYKKYDKALYLLSYIQREAKEMEEIYNSDDSLPF